MGGPLGFDGNCSARHCRVTSFEPHVSSARADTFTVGTYGTLIRGNFSASDFSTLRIPFAASPRWAIPLVYCDCRTGLDPVPLNYVVVDSVRYLR